MIESEKGSMPAVTIAPPRRRRLWLRVLLVLVVFVGGMGVGAGATVLVAVHRLKDALAHPDRMPPQIAARLERRLSLRPEQTAQVRAILTERQRKLMDIRRRVRPEVIAEMDRSYEDVRAVLDDKQRSRWERLYQEVKAEWMPPLPPGPDSRPGPAGAEH